MKIIKNWNYNFAPKVYYDNSHRLTVDEYRIDYTKDDKAHYNFVKQEDKIDPEKVIESVELEKNLLKKLFGK